MAAAPRAGHIQQQGHRDCLSGLSCCWVSQGPFLPWTELQTRGPLSDLGLAVHICFPASPLPTSKPRRLRPAMLPENWGSGKGRRGGGSALATISPGTQRPCPDTAAVSLAGHVGLDLWSHRVNRAARRPPGPKPKTACASHIPSG